MSWIQPVSERRFFSLEEARGLLPLLQRITRQSEKELQARIPLLSRAEGKQRGILDDEIHALYHAWQEKIRRLGGVTKGMWLVDFDSGEGYYCWQYPETHIEHFHGYNEGFLGRVKLHEDPAENHSSR